MSLQEFKLTPTFHWCDIPLL